MQIMKKLAIPSQLQMKNSGNYVTTMITMSWATLISHKNPHTNFAWYQNNYGYDSFGIGMSVVVLKLNCI